MLMEAGCKQGGNCDHKPGGVESSVVWVWEEEGTQVVQLLGLKASGRPMDSPVVQDTRTKFRVVSHEKGGRLVSHQAARGGKDEEAAVSSLF